MIEEDTLNVVFLFFQESSVVLNACTEGLFAKTVMPVCSSQCFRAVVGFFFPSPVYTETERRVRMQSGGCVKKVSFPVRPNGVA